MWKPSNQAARYALSRTELASTVTPRVSRTPLRIPKDPLHQSDAFAVSAATVLACLSHSVMLGGRGDIDRFHDARVCLHNDQRSARPVRSRCRAHHAPGCLLGNAPISHPAAITAGQSRNQAGCPAVSTPATRRCQHRARSAVARQTCRSMTREGENEELFRFEVVSGAPQHMVYEE